jgi:hypothetical protein
MAHLLSLGRFYGIDSIIDILIICISLLIFTQSKRIYNLIKEKNFNYFSFAFLGIAIAYFFKVIINLTYVYYITLSDVHLRTCLNYIIEELEFMQLINLFSTLFFKVFLLGGFLILFLISIKNRNNNSNLLFMYFSIIIILMSLYFDFLFNLTIVFILISLVIYFYKNSKKVNSKQSKLIFISFLPILLSNLLGIFYNGGTTIYLIEEILLFIGFLILFLTHLKFRVKNEKKNKTRGN